MHLQFCMNGICIMFRWYYDLVKYVMCLVCMWDSYIMLRPYDLVLFSFVNYSTLGGMIVCQVDKEWICDGSSWLSPWIYLELEMDGTSVRDVCLIWSRRIHTYAVIVGLGGPQPTSHSNKSPCVCVGGETTRQTDRQTEIHFISSIILENPGIEGGLDCDLWM